MSEKMYPIPFRSLMNWVVTEVRRLRRRVRHPQGSITPPARACHLR